MNPVRVVAATRLSEALFWRGSYLGRSLSGIPEELRPRISVRFGNTGSGAQGLSELYNHALLSVDDGEYLAFVHDDVYLHDWCFTQRVADALERFDIAGVAGAVNPDLQQPSWALNFDAQLTPLGWQPDRQRSGLVNHFDYGHPEVSFYGPTPQPCQLLDGLLLIVRTSVARRHGLRFDPQFRFHFYDLDFCRAAIERGLRVGTWPIAVTHNSDGRFGGDDFKQAARRYLDKWAAPPAPR